MCPGRRPPRCLYARRDCSSARVLMSPGMAPLASLCLNRYERDRGNPPDPDMAYRHCAPARCTHPTPPATDATPRRSSASPVSQGEERTLDRRSPPTIRDGQPCSGDRRAASVRRRGNLGRCVRLYGGAGVRCPVRCPAAVRDRPPGRTPGRRAGGGPGYGGAPRRRLIPTRTTRQDFQVLNTASATRRDDR
jgi:hypothetical protein